MSDSVQIPLLLLDDIKEFLDQRSDIRDTSDGTAPNKAMELLERIEREAIKGYFTFGGGGGVGGPSNQSGSAGEPSNPSQRVQGADGFVRAMGAGYDTDPSIGNFCGHSGRQCMRSDPRVCLKAGRCMGI